MTINAGNYPVIIEPGLLSHAGRYAAEHIGKCRAVVVSDDCVEALYGKTLENSLAEAGFDVVRGFVFPHGEENKNIKTLTDLLNHMAESGLTRSDVVFALGGGVVGDTAGFAAAVYMRGVRYVQIPTTLLADVDSSLGGKVGIDLDSGKNLAGAFCEPSLVLCDPELLSSLPVDIFSDGMAEAVKMGIIRGGELFSLVCDGGDVCRMTELCAAAKCEIVNNDFTEQGERKVLNLGHTIAHALEVLSGYKISHGRAVAAGLYIITKAAWRRGMCTADLPDRIDGVLRKYFGADYAKTGYTAEEISSAAMHDKKFSGDKITLAVPRDIGNVSLIEIMRDELNGFIGGGM